MSEEQKRNWFEKFTTCMDQNIRGVQYGVYSIALVGLGIALRSVRPFKKFSHPQEIPKSFIDKHITLNGKVAGVEPPLPSSPPLLLVDHSPIISLAWLRPRTQHLSVHISSVDISTNGYSWLQHVVVGSKVSFTVMKVNPNFASCIVTKKRKNVAMDLVSLGFASVSPLDLDLDKDSMYLKYYKQLLNAENHAEKHGSGMWATDKVSPTTRIKRKISQGINHGTDILKKGVKSVLSKSKPNTLEPLAPSGKI